MYTEAVKMLDLLAGKVSDEVVQVLRSVLGNCAQPLVHRGPVTFDGPITVEGAASSASSGAAWAIAASTWVNDATTPYVDCYKRTARAGSTTPDVIRIYLPRTAVRDPNVRANDILGYALLTRTTGVCTTGYLDDKIGRIKAWGDPNNVPGGWELVSSGRMIAGYAVGDPDFGTVGGSGGNKTHLHDSHNAAGIANHAASNTGSAGGFTLTMPGFTELQSESGSLTGVSGGNITSAGGSLTTNAMSDLPNLQGSGNVDSSDIDVNDPGHQHTLDVPGDLLNVGYDFDRLLPNTATSYTDMTFDGSSLSISGGAQVTAFPMTWSRSDIVSGVEMAAHTHSVSYTDIAAEIDAGPHNHTLSMSAHQHAMSGDATIGDHSHTLPELEHSGSLSHGDTSHLPPYRTVCWIRRVA